MLNNHFIDNFLFNLYLTFFFANSLFFYILQKPKANIFFVFLMQFIFLDLCCFHFILNH